jgi:hypothetical protein
MQRDTKIEQQLQKGSTSKITDTLGMGGPPLKPIVYGPRKRIYDGTEEIKIDERGCAYIGVSIEELKQREEEMKKSVVSSTNLPGSSTVDVDKELSFIIRLK